ncbi:MAG: hypothetical protein ACE5HA_16860 [Anaerolineae bacterium]
MTTFPIRLDAIWRIPLLLITVTPQRAYVALDDQAITFRFGWLEERIELTEIESVEPMRWRIIYGIGTRIAPGRTLGLVGSWKDVVAIRLRTPRTIKVPFKMDFRRIAASMEEPEVFIEALQARLDALERDRM